MATTSEAGTVPERALFDTGVVIRALGDRPDDARSPDCVSLWERMIAEKKTILISAVSIAEIGAMKLPVPVVPSVVVVPFDRTAALICADLLSPSVIEAYKKNAKLPNARAKYDALIVACAKRWAVDALVALDEDIDKLATKIGLRCLTPEAYRSAQVPLPFGRSKT